MLIINFDFCNRAKKKKKKKDQSSTAGRIQCVYKQLNEKPSRDQHEVKSNFPTVR